MEPKFIQMGGKRYRLFERNTNADKLNAMTRVENFDQPELKDNKQENHSIDVEITAKGPGYTHSFYVPKPFFGFIIGPRGSILQKIERDTKTLIRIPGMRDSGDVTITSGADPMGIVSAKHQITSIVEQSRNKMKTHFLSIPLRDDSIASNFEKFKIDVLTETGKNAKGVKEELFQKPTKMHLTLGDMLVLVDDNEIKTAIDALQECHETIIKPIAKKNGVIKIRLRGLKCFNKDPANVRVLFAKVTSENDVLQELAEKIVGFFKERGLMRNERAEVNLHMTVMNSSFMIDKKLSRFQQSEKFDATDILKVHEDYVFGETTLRTIHICKFCPTAEDGYYEITSKVNLDE